MYFCILYFQFCINVCTDTYTVIEAIYSGCVYWFDNKEGVCAPCFLCSCRWRLLLLSGASCWKTQCLHLTGRPREINSNHSMLMHTHIVFAAHYYSQGVHSLSGSLSCALHASTVSLAICLYLFFVILCLCDVSRTSFSKKTEIM